MLKAWAPRICVCVGVASAVLVACAPVAGACPNEGLRTGPSAALPDCRAYEVVSPADKNGGDVLASSSRVRAAVGGDAVQFGSLVGFGDIAGTSLSSDYVAERTGAPGTSGWSTHGISPGDPTTFLDQFVNAGVDSVYTGEFSSDLADGLVFSFASLSSDSPNTVSDSFLKVYRRSNLLSAGGGSFQLVTGCPGCSAPITVSPDTRPAPAGSSADFSHVIFESVLNLTSDSVGLNPTLPKLYEWTADGGTGGTVSLVGQVPVSGVDCGSGGPVCVPAANSQAGGGALVKAPGGVAIPQHYTPGAISNDGSRIFFTVRSDRSVATGALYLRTNNGTSSASTVQVNVAEPTPNPTSQDAFFEMATPDGAKVFFTTKEKLTPDDTSDANATNLYVYDVNAPAGHHLTLISKPDPGMGVDVQGLVGASDDGRYVYFISNDQLLSGQPPAGGISRIFVWHDGVIHEVGAVASDDVPTVALTATAGWRFAPRASQVSPDGSHLVFVSKNAGDGGADDVAHSGVGDACPAVGGCEEVYAYNATCVPAQVLTNLSCPPVCVSCHTPDRPSQTNASISGDYAGGAFGTTSHLAHSLSDDGRFVFFSTGDRLASQDSDGLVSDVYEYDTMAREVHVISSGAAGSLGSFFMDASANGHDAFFTTRDSLNDWDSDSQVDLYDARIDGGLPAPAAAPVPCVDDTCHGAPQASPVFGVPASGTIGGGGNIHPAKRKPVKHAVRCRRGLVRRRVHGRVRCVKVRHRAHKASHGRKGGR